MVEDEGVPPPPPAVVLLRRLDMATLRYDISVVVVVVEKVERRKRSSMRGENVRKEKREREKC